MNEGIHVNTPQLAVIDSRGLPVRQVAYWRRDIVEVMPESRITVQQHDSVGRLVTQRDPRFLAPASRPNMTTVYSLSGQGLLTDSADAGWRLALPGEAGPVQTHWDGRGSHWQHEYDEQQRLIAIHEQTPGSNLRTIERLTYADNSVEFAERNQCGQLIRHDDPAGVVWFKQQALSGGLIRQARRFLPAMAGIQADWPALEADRDSLLQPGDANVTESRLGPLGEVFEQTDAGGHRQHFNVDRSGQIQRIELTLKSQAPQPLLKAAQFNAEGQLLIQITGNDVTNSATYEASTGRLKRLTATTSEDVRLQDQHYEYDPVGNIVRLVDQIQPVTFFASQRVAAENTYTYDSLYQLTCATGRETVDAGQNTGLPELITPSPIDPARLLNYIEYYEYDAGGNRTELRHVSEKKPFRQQMRVSPQSNRALPWNEGDDEPDFTRDFDANGNLQRLVPGTQPMTWDARNQLHGVTTIRRSTAADDGEWYRYDASGARVVKFYNHQGGTIAHNGVVHYLPGLEVRSTDDTAVLQVICVTLARGSVRCLHWVKGKPEAVSNDQMRYSVDDQLGSVSLEVDQQAAVISHEGYYPFGGTAWWAARSSIDADYKTIRYSGKERDACGLYYYGFRYYAPWLGRWVNPDPAGDIDGLNRFRMVGNNPIAHRDPYGQNEVPINKDIHQIWVGEAAHKLKTQVTNLNNTVEQADGYKVRLYLETAMEDAYTEITKDLRAEVVLLNDSELFTKFNQTPLSRIYNDFRWGSARNAAFAVDVLRVFTVHELGGLYSDVDDVYYPNISPDQLRLGNNTLYAEPNQVIIMHPVTVPWECSQEDKLQISNSSFGAHAGSSILKEIMTEMTLRYNKAVDSKKYEDQLGLGYIGTGILEADPIDRAAIMTSMVGPGVFTDVLTRSDSNINSIYSHFKYHNDKIASAALISQSYKSMPLHRFIKPGRFDSWE